MSDLLDKEIAFIEALLKDPCDWCTKHGNSTPCETQCSTIRILEEKLKQLKKRKQREERKGK